MPAFSTHYLFAKDMMPEIRRLFPFESLNEDAVFYGTQGPDFLFFHRILPTMPGKSLNYVGSAVHKSDPAALFEAMADYIAVNVRCDKETAYSYFCGFILHYALDRAVHPFVYWAVDEIKKNERSRVHPFIVHNRIEFNMDMHFLREKENVTDARKYGTKRLLSGDEKLINEIATASAFAFSAVCPGKIYSANKFAQAFLDFRCMQGLINDYRAWKIPLIKAIQFPLKPLIGPGLTAMMLLEKPDEKFDYMNKNKASWSYPGSENYSEKSVFELFEEAKAEASEMLAGFAKCIAGEADPRAVFGKRSFLTGMDFDLKEKK